MLLTLHTDNIVVITTLTQFAKLNYLEYFNSCLNKIIYKHCLTNKKVGKSFTARCNGLLVV